MELDEIKAEGQRLSPWAHMATVGADGKPDVVPVHPAWEGDTLWVFASEDSVKCRNIAHQPEVALHWQVTEAGDGLEVWGTASVHTDVDTKRRLWTGVFDYNLDDFAAGGPEATWHRVHRRGPVPRRLPQGLRHGRDQPVEGRLTHLSRSIAGKRAIVTGAASGMGRATAHLFADEGARVAVVDLGEDRVGAVVEEIRSVHGPEAAQGWAVDVSDARAGRPPRRRGGGGVRRSRHPRQQRRHLPPAGARPDDAEFDEVWAATLAVNLTAQARMVRAALPFLAAAEAGGWSTSPPPRG